MSDRDLIKKFWEYPNLRNQIPNLIDSARKKFFLLRDATEKAELRWSEMESEYNHLLMKEQEKNNGRRPL